MAKKKGRENLRPWQDYQEYYRQWRAYLLQVNPAKTEEAGIFESGWARYQFSEFLGKLVDSVEDTVLDNGQLKNLYEWYEDTQPIKKVVQYETQDGGVYDTLEEAERHVRGLAFIKWYNGEPRENALYSTTCKGCCLDAGNVLDWLEKHKEVLKGLLK